MEMRNKVTVLVVDSQPEDRERTVRYLEEAGYSTIAAEDPDSAIHYLFQDLFLVRLP